MKLIGENRRTRRKTCPSATLSTTNPTWTEPGSNPGLRGGRPAANRLSDGTPLTLDLTLSQMNLVHSTTLYRMQILFNIILPRLSMFLQYIFPSVFLPMFCMEIELPHACCMFRPSYPP
jgi:hypothetical protein